MNPFWLVWNPLGGVPTFKHPDPDSARKEAERLAALFPNQHFFVLASVGCARKVESIWSDIDHSSLPF